ncbi:MAG: hypothetical protein IPK83_13885 [Planctomycetes bacterium]|nr:hypothetical protein [Planctomycetota bacterium]
MKDGDTAVGYYLGYDKATNETVPVYFRLLHAVIADSIAMGCKRLSLGRTALEPKARLGARPVPLNVDTASASDDESDAAAVRGAGAAWGGTGEESV